MVAKEAWGNGIGGMKGRGLEGVGDGGGVRIIFFIVYIKHILR